MLSFKVSPSFLNTFPVLEENSLSANFNGRSFAPYERRNKYCDLWFHWSDISRVFAWLTDELCLTSGGSVQQDCCRTSCDHMTCAACRHQSKISACSQTAATTAIILFLHTLFCGVNRMPGRVSESYTHNVCVYMNMCTCSWCHLQMLYLCILYKNKISHHTFCHLDSFHSFAILHVKVLQTHFGFLVLSCSGASPDSIY